MTKITICLTVLLLINFLDFGVALKCYKCDAYLGVKGQLCNMNLRTNKTHVVAHECNEKIKHPMCVKIIERSIKQNKKLSVSRFCVEKDSLFCEKQKKKIKKVRFCGTCTGNYCNSAPALSTLFNKITIMAPVILFFIFT